MELRMSDKERDRLEVMRRLSRGETRQVDVARALGLSTRQVRRIGRRIEREGDRGLIHRARGRPSNRRTPREIERRAKALLREKSHDFGATLAQEHLAEDDAITLCRETVRRFMHEEHLWANQRKPRLRGLPRRRRLIPRQTPSRLHRPLSVRSVSPPCGGAARGRNGISSVTEVSPVTRRCREWRNRRGADPASAIGRASGHAIRRMEVLENSWILDTTPSSRSSDHRWRWVCMASQHAFRGDGTGDPDRELRPRSS